MSLLVHPHKTLSTPTSDVESAQEALEIEQVLRTAIKEDCTWGHCVGLASNQIGLKKSAFIARGKFYVNPKIVKHYRKQYTMTEGCYSLKGEQFVVKRYPEILVSYCTPDDMSVIHDVTLKGFDAQVFQHEMDHLLGFTIKERSI